MSKVRTALFLLKEPKKLLNVFVEKFEMHLSQSIKRELSLIERDFEVLNNIWLDNSSLNRKRRKKLNLNREGDKLKAIIFSSYFGMPGTLASSNYYSNWLYGLRENGIDAFILAPKTTKKPIVDTGFVSGPLFIAPFKKFNFDANKIISDISPDYILFHNDPDSLQVASSLHKQNVFKAMFVGDAMTHRITDSQARTKQIEGIVKEFDALIVVSEFLKKTWVDYGFNIERIYVTKTPVNAKMWPKHIGSNHGTRAAYFGNIYHKEIENLLEISQTVKVQFPNFKLDIFGDGQQSDMDDLKEKINFLGLSQTVSLFNSVSVEEMRVIHSKVDLLLLPREKAEFSEAGFPNKVGEYLASGCPSIITKVSNLENILNDKENVFLVDPNDNKKFAKVVIDVIRNYEEAKIVGARGRRLIEEYSSCEEVAGQWIRWVNDVKK